MKGTGIMPWYKEGSYVQPNIRRCLSGQVRHGQGLIAEHRGIVSVDAIGTRENG